MHYRDWIERALYDREGGYYSTRLKSVPDYVTAPSFGPYLGCAVARELIRGWREMPRMARPKVFTLVEAGCGSEAALTKSALETLNAEEPDLLDRLQVILAERSVARLGAALETLGRAFTGKVYGCPDISQIPRIWGAVVSNELLDALPVHLIRRRQTEVQEACVEKAAGGGCGFQWKKCDDPVVTSFGLELPADVSYALNREALKFLEIVSDRLAHGLLVSIDFGDAQPAIFSRVPVKAFSKGAVKLPNWNTPGTEDLTSPVDFGLLMDWGGHLGLEALSYETLSSFLIRHRIGEMLSSGAGREAVEGNLKIKALIHPQGFGEDFKVLIQGK
mgnify:CR=1 FL=1